MIWSASFVVVALVLLIFWVFRTKSKRVIVKDKVDDALEDLKSFKTHQAIQKLNAVIEAPPPQSSDEEKVDSLWALATLYNFGDNFIEPNRLAALEIYKAMLENDLAMTEARKVDVNERINLLDTHIPWVRNYRFTKESPPVKQLVHVPVPDQVPVIIPPKPAKIFPKIRNDPQNVHDTTLVNTLSKSVNDIKKDTNFKPENDGWLQEIVDYINHNDTTASSKKNAQLIVDVFRKRDGYLSSANTTELEALELVWKRIKNNHSDNKDLKDMLVHNLADSIENNSALCVSGTVARIMDTLQTVDDKVDIKPDWAIRSEMLSKASAIRNSMIAQRPEEERRLIEGLEANTLQEEFTETFRKHVRHTLSEEYVDSGIMSPAKLDAELKDWLSSIE